MFVQLIFTLVVCYSTLLTVDSVQVLRTFQGDETILGCQCDNCRTVLWHFAPVGTVHDDILLYSSGTLMNDASRLNITLLPSNTTGRHDLLITMTTVANAGEYMCNAVRIEVVVLLDRQLRCVSNSDEMQLAEHDNITFSCELLYVASRVVKVGVEWSDDSKPSSSKELVSHNETVVNITHKHFKTTVRIVAGSSRLGPVLCSVYFTGISNTSVKTTPLQHSFPSVDVEFGVNNIRVNTTTDGVYHIGYTLRCLADGRPAAVYRWTEVRPGGMDADVNSSELVLKTAGRHVYKCTAWNVVRGQTHSVTSQVDQLVVLGEPEVEVRAVESATTTTIEDAGDGSRLMLLAIGVTATVLLLLFLLLVALLSHRYKRSRGRRHVTDDASVSFSSCSSPVSSMSSPLFTHHHAVPSLLTQQQTEIYDEIDFKLANKLDKEQLMSDNTENEMKIGFNWTTETPAPDIDMSRDFHCYSNTDAIPAAGGGVCGSDVTDVYVSHSHCIDCEPRYMEPHRNQLHHCSHLPPDWTPPAPLPPPPPGTVVAADTTGDDNDAVVYLHFK